MVRIFRWNYLNITAIWIFRSDFLENCSFFYCTRIFGCFIPSFASIINFKLFNFRFHLIQFQMASVKNFSNWPKHWNPSRISHCRTNQSEQSIVNIVGLISVVFLIVFYRSAQSNEPNFVAQLQMEFFILKIQSYSIPVTSTHLQHWFNFLNLTVVEINFIFIKENAESSFILEGSKKHNRVKMNHKVPMLMAFCWTTLVVHLSYERLSYFSSFLDA